MAIICVYGECVRLLIELRPDIWADFQLLSIVENCQELMPNLGGCIENDPHVHFLGVNEAWQIVVGGLVESDGLIFQRSLEVGCLIRDIHFEQEELFGLLLLAIRQLALDVINSNVLIQSSIDLHGEILFIGS
jgi:hypothetical protein